MNKLEKEILEKIGNNKTEELSFTGNKIEKYLGFYTYKGVVCVLDGAYDHNFNDLPIKDQKNVHNHIMKNLYTKY